MKSERETSIFNGDTREFCNIRWKEHSFMCRRNILLQDYFKESDFWLDTELSSISMVIDRNRKLLLFSFVAKKTLYTKRKPLGSKRNEKKTTEK